jgi:uncharacterized protein YuzE
MNPVLEYDEAADAAYLSFSDGDWDHQVRLDDGRGINYAADGTVIGVELLSPGARAYCSTDYRSATTSRGSCARSVSRFWKPLARPPNGRAPR